MSHYWSVSKSVLGYILQEISYFGMWLALGGALGALLGLLVAWICARKFYPRHKFARLDAHQPPAPRWLFLSMPLWRWSWWLMWWSALPSCVIAMGLVWGAAEGSYRAMLRQPLTPEISHRASLHVLGLIWKTQAPAEWKELDPDKPLPTSQIFPVLHQACEHPVAGHIPSLESNQKLAWMTDLLARRIIGWYCHCQVESRRFYLQAIQEEVCRTQGRTVSLRQVAGCACQRFVEPQLANWCRIWVLGLGSNLFELLLALIVLPRLAFEIGFWFLGWRASRGSQAMRANSGN